MRRNTRQTREGRRYNTYLLADQALEPGDRVYSKNGRHRLILQGDGNLCLYEEGEHRWCSRVTQPDPTFAIMQGDGNFVQYAGTPSNNSRIELWASKTKLGIFDAFYIPAVVVRDDGTVSVVLTERGSYGDERMIKKELKRIF